MRSRDEAYDVYESFFETFGTFNYNVLGHAYHLDRTELDENAQFERWTRQIKSLGVYWGGSME